MSGVEKFGRRSQGAYVGTGGRTSGKASVVYQLLHGNDGQVYDQFLERFLGLS